MSTHDTIISFYKFTAIKDPFALKRQLKPLCLSLKLRGTIIVAQEGINGMVSGTPDGIDQLIAFFKADERFADVVFKKSFYHDTSFRRMLVKVKKQCITLRVSVDPTKNTGKRLSPEDFKAWMDSGREMILVDTRNDYEVAIGTFKGAIDPKIKSFDEFPQWLAANLQEAKDKPVVTFCTGGIRCEKATAYMQQVGFNDVYQLDGGIITYLEKTQDDAENNHWEGECVVFDKRRAVDKYLRPSTHEHCFVCLSQLTPHNTSLKVFPAGKACSVCAQTMQEHREVRQQKGLDRHQENIEKRRAFVAGEREKFKNLKHSSPTPEPHETHKECS